MDAFDGSSGPKDTSRPGLAVTKSGGGRAGLNLTRIQPNRIHWIPLVVSTVVCLLGLVCVAAEIPLALLLPVPDKPGGKGRTKSGGGRRQRRTASQGKDADFRDARCLKVSCLGTIPGVAMAATRESHRLY